MILELDCGNSLIKWRVIRVAGLTTVAFGVADSDAALLERLCGCEGLALRHCRLVSVRSEQETASLVQALNDAFGIAASIAQPAEVLAGVRNGYREYQRLGLDRWVALVAGYKLAGGACLVLDLGTAVTSDLVDAAGQHLGAISARACP